MFYLRVLLATLGFLAASVYGIVISLVRRDRSRLARDYARMLARLVRPALGTRVEVHGEERLYERRPCVFISNHQTILDAPILAGIFPHETAVVAKQGIRKIPLFGWLYEVTGNILIDRADRAKAVGRLREAEEAIRQRGVSVWIFPEGTRGTAPGELLPFKKGAFHMAVATGVPLVPVVVSPLKQLYDLENRCIRPGTAEVRVLEPIPTTGLKEDDLLPLMEEAHRRMAAALAEMAVRREFLPPPPGKRGR